MISESQAERDYDDIMARVVREFRHLDENHNDFFIDPEAPVRVDSQAERTFGSLGVISRLAVPASEPSIPDELH